MPSELPSLTEQRTRLRQHKSCSICFSCGASKTAYDVSCPACDRSPFSIDDVAQSLLLSSSFQLDVLGLPKSREELLALSECIASGRGDCIAADELEEVKRHLADVEAFGKRWTLQRVLSLWVAPAVLLLTFVGCLALKLFLDRG